MTVIDFLMPSLGADMDSGTVTEWMIESGDTVGRGDIVAIVETDKADIDIEVWDDGTVAEILIPVGQQVPVGTPLARLEVSQRNGDRKAAPAERPDVAPPPPVRTQVRTPPPVAAPDRPTPPPAAASRTGGVMRTAASPLARRLAHERGIDLASVPGTGPDGAVRATDLDAGPTPRPTVAQATESETETRESEPSAATRMRRAIGELLTRSKQEIPHYYLATDVDLEAMLSRLSEINAQRSVSERILPAAFLIKAVAVAAAQHQDLNGFWLEDRFQPADRVHIGVAVSLRGGGLVAPAIHDADRLPIDELMVGLRDLVGRARSGRLRGSEMTDPTLTVSNLGDRGVDMVQGVIYPPQVALVGLGRVSKRAAVVDDEVVARRQVTLSLSADHRASDGQVGARFLNTIERLLQAPEELES